MKMPAVLLGTEISTFRLNHDYRRCFKIENQFCDIKLTSLQPSFRGSETCNTSVGQSESVGKEKYWHTLSWSSATLSVDWHSSSTSGFCGTAHLSTSQWRNNLNSKKKTTLANTSGPWMKLREGASLLSSSTQIRWAPKFKYSPKFKINNNKHNCASKDQTGQSSQMFSTGTTDRQPAPHHSDTLQQRNTLWLKTFNFFFFFLHQHRQQRCL